MALLSWGSRRPSWWNRGPFEIRILIFFRLTALRWLRVAAAIDWLLVAALIYSVARGREGER